MTTRRTPTRIEDITWRDYIDVQIKSVTDAAKVASDALDKRLDSMNEFRASMKDQSATFLTRTEFLIFREQTDKDIRSLSESRAEMRGKASQMSVIFSYAIAILGIILSIVK